MDRTVIDPMEQMRDFDFVMFEHDVLVALGGLVADVTSGLPQTVLGGLMGSQTTIPSLGVNISAGRIYQFAPSDAVSAGSIPADTSVIVQQGYNPAQIITLVAPAPGQSQWNLIQAQFSQVDAVRAGDPNGGIVPFYNAANPTQPTSQSINTIRKGTCVLQVVTGSAATTGTEVPPQATGGWVPLYLIDLAGNQTQITTGQILIAGPSVGTGVPANYAAAPFLAGLLASHHNGTAGQAPKIKLGSEVQGILPYANMSAVRTFLTANLTLYVNASTGSDNSQGLTSGTAFQTIPAALNSIYRNYDFAGFAATISVANGAYTAGVVAVGTPPGMTGPVTIIGNVATPASVTIAATNSNCFDAQAGANLSVSGFLLTATGVSDTYSIVGTGIVARTSSRVVFGNIIFGTCSNGHLVTYNSGNIQSLGNPYTIIGGALTHLSAVSAGEIVTVNSVVTLSGSPAFSIAFAYTALGGMIAVYTQSFVGIATGSRYATSQNGVVNTNGASATYLPGNSPGTAISGGQYV